jgi:predicted nucleotidyltransferase
VTTPLEELAGRSGDGFPHLLAARERTERELAAARDRLAGVARDEDASIVLFGSWGRRELTSGSDDDWLVMVAGERRDDVRPASEAVTAVLGRQPGTQAVFGEVVFCAELAGTCEATSRTTARRASSSTTSSAIGGRSPSTSSARSGRAGARRARCAT